MLIYFVIVPILIAVFLYLFPNAKIAKIIALTVQVGLVGAVSYLFYLSRESDIITVIGAYEEAMGILLRVDYLSAVFILLTAFIFLMAALYSFRDNNSRLFWLLLFIWEGAVIGIFMAGDLFNIFVLMEVATLTVTVLIMYNRLKRSIYDGLIYLMINFVGIQFYLLGLGYLYRSIGVLEMNTAAYAVQNIGYGRLVLPYAFIMTYIALKCALLPLFSWLPKAHSTPGASPAVSAILSGLHIKSGVYLFLRFQEVFYGMAQTYLFMAIGLITAVVGIVMALSQRNIKRILAYSTMAQVGLIIAGFSIGSYYNAMGAMYHVVNHALFKAALFLGAGTIAVVYQTKDIDKIRGVLKQMPLVGTAMIFAVFGIIGMPLFNGSISKYFLMYEVHWLLNVIMICINFGTITVFVKFSAMFMGKPSEAIKTDDRDILKEIPLVVLGCMCLVFGIFGANIMSILLNWDAHISIGGYLQKTAIFAVSLAVSWPVYNRLIKGRQWLIKIRETDLGFREMCVAMGAFFAVVLVAAGFIGGS